MLPRYLANVKMSNLPQVNVRSASADSFVCFKRRLKSEIGTFGIHCSAQIRVFRDLLRYINFISCMISSSRFTVSLCAPRQESVSEPPLPTQYFILS